MLPQIIERESQKPSVLDRKICFINPPYNIFIESLDAPFNLMYLAAIAEQCGWQAEILDMKTMDDKIPEADIYGVTATSPQWHDACLIGGFLTSLNKGLTIIGGNHVSAFLSEDPHNRVPFNVAVIGEGENPLKAILTTYNKLRRGHSIFSHPPIENLDTIPFPARHLIDWSRHKRGIYWGKEQLADAVSIITSRGCPFNCVFCGSHVVFERRVRYRSVENVVAEMRHVIDTMGYYGFNFHDDTFCINKKRVIELCRGFIKLKTWRLISRIYWRCLSRVDTIDIKVLDWMQLAGCCEIILGVESGSQTILNNLRKGVTVKQNRNAMKLIKKQTNIQLKVGIIVGSPGETWDTVKETEELLKEHPPDFWNISVFTPFPGSYAWKHPEKLGLKILTRDLQQYAMVGKDYKGNVVVETEKMSKEDIEQARDRLIDLLLDISGENYT